MFLTRPITILLSSLVAVGCSGMQSSAGKSGDLVALQQVAESFRTSIINKDKTTFMSLFFSDKPEEVTWQSVVDDPSLDAIKLTRPQAIKARRRPDNNFVAFIDGVVTEHDGDMVGAVDRPCEQMRGAVGHAASATCFRR